MIFKTFHLTDGKTNFVVMAKSEEEAMAKINQNADKVKLVGEIQGTFCFNAWFAGTATNLHLVV